MEDYQKRVVDERADLANKLEKLTSFVCSNEQFKRLPVEDKSLLRKQTEVMHEYLMILDMRIDRFKK